MSTHVSLPTPAILPLEPGDRLSRDEFERRYDAMPQLKKAELIEGVVYMPSPVRLRQHGQPHVDFLGCLALYRARTAGILAGDNASIRLDLDNMPQPDALLLIEPKCGGQARISDDDYVEDAPELVGEIASSSASFDVHTKLHVYRRNSVKEYVVWRVLDHQIDWFVLRGSEYEKLQPDQDGILKSEAFPGLWLDAQALIRGDLATVFAALEQGLASPEHQEFVTRLQQAAGS